MKRVMLLLVFVCSSFVVFGQFQVGGIVEDTNGTSLIGANVILEGTYLGTSTGLSGKFVFHNVNNETYTLKVSYMGYETKREEINVQKNLKERRKHTFN